jgi:hypothetical protein
MHRASGIAKRSDVVTTDVPRRAATHVCRPVPARLPYTR